MNISIIVIGDEILLGQVTDTNSGEIARIIGSSNWTVNRVTTVGDNAADITSAIESSLATSDIVITTGGLGPTKDDITKSVLLNIFGGKLVQNEEVLQNVKEICEKRHIELNELTRTQALVPSTAKIIQNRAGTAPIMWFERGNSVLVTLPGVPHETSQMMKAEVFPRLLSKFGEDVTVSHRNLLVYGIIESKIAEILDSWEDELPECLHLAYLPVPGYVKLRLDGVHKDGKYINELLDKKAVELHELLGDAIFADEDLPVAEIALKELRKRGLTLSTAESCTGGNIAHNITLVPGSSDVYMGSVVSYSNDVKVRLLGVDRSLIDSLGAVSEPVAMQMANGVARATKTDCSISTSGIAGPGGGSAEKPVGTVCIAIHTPDREIVTTKFFPGNRSRIIDRATTVALIMLIKSITV